MADSENPKNNKTDIDLVLADFESKKEDLARLGEKTKDLLEDFLNDASIRYQSIQVRVKSKSKLREKYLDPTKNYSRLDDITDQLALRVITYYKDEIDRVSEIVKREFEVDHGKSVDKRKTKPDKFGYYAINNVCKYSNSRISQTEYKRFAKVPFELQITSVLRHAWA